MQLQRHCTSHPMWRNMGHPYSLLLLPITRPGRMPAPIGLPENVPLPLLRASLLHQRDRDDRIQELRTNAPGSRIYFGILVPRPSTGTNIRRTEKGGTRNRENRNKGRKERPERIGKEESRKNTMTNHHLISKLKTFWKYRIWTIWKQLSYENIHLWKANIIRNVINIIYNCIIMKICKGRIFKTLLLLFLSLKRNCIK